MSKHQAFKKCEIFQPYFFTCHLPGRQNIFSNFPDLAGTYGRDSGVPTNISNIFSHYIQRSRCAYHDFWCVQSLYPKVQVCLPKFPMSLVIICYDQGVPTNISNALSHHLQRSRCAYQHFQCLQSLSGKNQECLPTFPMFSVIVCKDPSVPTNIFSVFSHYLQRSRCATNIL